VWQAHKKSHPKVAFLLQATNYLAADASAAGAAMGADASAAGAIGAAAAGAGAAAGASSFLPQAARAAAAMMAASTSDLFMVL
jgi:hypothetical protein